MLDRSPIRPLDHFQLECVLCRERLPGRFATLCRCGGMLDTAYDLRKVQLHDSPNPFVRFADLLPVRDPTLFPVDASYTPCVHAARLGERIGLRNLYLKDETPLPTGTTKYRSAVIVLSMLIESDIRSFATSSTGNAGTAYAYVMQMKQFSAMEMHLFVGEAFRNHCHYGDAPNVRVFALRGGIFEEAGAVSSAYAKQIGFYPDAGYFNPGKREGAKLAYFEATDQIHGPIDWYVQATSSGLGVDGTYKGALELLEISHITRAPRLLCVQEDTCAPQVRAWEEGCTVIEPRHVVHRPRGIAWAIHRGDATRAYTYLRAKVEQSKGAYCAVSESEIRSARAAVKEYEGLDICFNAAAAVAGTIREARRGTIDPNETVLVNLTGSDRSPETATRRVTWLEQRDGAWISECNTIRIP
jgi:threonine synthase